MEQGFGFLVGKLPRIDESLETIVAEQKWPNGVVLIGDIRVVIAVFDASISDSIGTGGGCGPEKGVTELDEPCASHKEVIIVVVVVTLFGSHRKEQTNIVDSALNRSCRKIHGPPMFIGFRREKRQNKGTQGDLIFP